MTYVSAVLALPKLARHRVDYIPVPP